MLEEASNQTIRGFFIRK